MRHGKKVNHLGRKTAHRSAMLANMACSLIEHKRINTTVAKAKALKQFIEPLITKSKAENNKSLEKGTHNRRIVFRNLRDKYAVSELFSTVSEKIGDRPGGYTRIIKLGNRLGDNADMAMIELVDFNEIYNAGKAKKKKSTRRSRSSKKAETTAVATEEKKEAEVEAPKAEAAAEAKAPEAKAPKAEKPKKEAPKKEEGEGPKETKTDDSKE
ncbi:MAG: 50S ribosomal protein L17 [Eudoraea sp.]|nr:50S ribosomal protein L17 [Eudoraea sp.]